MPLTGSGERFARRVLQREISLIGDVPIFVALDSADVWARPDLFLLDEQGQPLVVAGVPPDYFQCRRTALGQPALSVGGPRDREVRLVDEPDAGVDRNGWIWSGSTISAGFRRYWEVPAGAATAAEGRWALGPGTAFLEALREGLGGLPLIAEDLGDITAEVQALRDRFDLPGMRVLQFGFAGEPDTDFHLPHRFVNHCIAYTGTHDNDTA